MSAKVTKCRECGYEIGMKVDICPNCGESLGIKVGGFRGLLTRIVFLLMALYVIYSAIKFLEH
jgi:hypothetical protein